MSVFSFDHDHGIPARDLVDLLGGKGAGLAEMRRGLGINVPPGFTLALDLSREYRTSGWPTGLEVELDRHLLELGTAMGRLFGDPDDPLLVAVRSGAPVSMPGMLDTVLNLGLNEQTVEGLARTSGDEAFAWDSYRRFLTMYATTVMGAEARDLPAAPSAVGNTLRDHVASLRDAIAAAAGRSVPEDPRQQLREAVEAVFRSWDCDRARAYREKEGLPDDSGTAVNVQAMVFGNRGHRSGTGVVFTRDPSSGAAAPFGDYLPRAQGEDVVAGTAHTLPIASLADELPDVYVELMSVLRRLEVHYRDMCDVEFTIEDGRLWLLQTRPGKRGAVASVKIAVDLHDDPEIGLSPAEAVALAPPASRERARAEVLSRTSHSEPPLTAGLGASPGRATGTVVLSSSAASASEGDVILVRAETSPEDVAGMAVSAGILTTRGGLVSHAAVVARGWGLPAVVGAKDLSITDTGVVGPGGQVIAQGDLITIDGATGEVWLGTPETASGAEIRSVEDDLPELARLESWAANDAHSPTPITETQGAAPMKISVDYDKCTALGICESLAPDFFEVDDDGDLQLVRADVPADAVALVEQAVAGCPTAALRLARG